MKKTKRIIVAMTLLIMAVFFMNSNKLSGGSVQAASKGTYRAILKAYKRNDYRKVQKLSKKLPKKANEKYARKLNAKYRKAARKVTRKLKKWKADGNYEWGVFWYAFSDINKNGKPELIVKYGSCATDNVIWIYEYKNGEYKKAKGGIKELWYPTVHNYTSGNGLVFQEWLLSERYSECVTFVTLKNGRIKQQFSRIREYDYISRKTVMPCKVKTYVPKN